MNTLDVETDATGRQEQPWELAAIRRVHMLHSQLDAAVAHAKASPLAELRGMDFLADDSPYMLRLQAFYREHLSLARLLDASDLLLHAEGPGAADHAPRLSAVNWLCQGAEKHMRALLAAMLPLSSHDSRAATRKADLRLTGLSPGSLYAGFALAGMEAASAQMPLVDEGDTVKALRSALHALPVVPQFVGNERIDPQIMEALPDPALRDAAMLAAYALTPTGQRGIHTVEISAPLASDATARAAQPLGQRERVVLRAATRGQPMLRQARRGSFSGVLRAIDLDHDRIVIRQVSGDIPALRCALGSGAAAATAKPLLDQWVRVEGEYECAPSGIPRLLRVEGIAPIQPPLL